MVVLLVILGLGVLAYLTWKCRMTTLTRNCRWRQDRARGDWVCAYCNERIVSEKTPLICVDPNRVQGL